MDIFYFEQIKNLLFKEFGQAWICVLILYVILTGFIRCLLTSPVKKSSKRISSKNLKPIQSRYLFMAISGWLIYALSAALCVLAWYAYFFQIYGLQSVAWHFAAASAFLYMLAIVTHVTSFASACLDQIKLLEDKQLTP